IHWKASARYHKLQEKVCEPSIQEKILIVVDVQLFHSSRAKADFECMLEAAAAMAVYFVGKGNAVGFMTNAVIKGNTPCFVPLSRNRQSLSAILETIARMEMKSGSELIDIFHGHISRLWGISCIFCSHDIDSSILKMKTFYTKKRIPIKYFVSTTENKENEKGILSDTVQEIASICM
ncbi:MAG: DUF58 domain-containing protein, partial [Desulfobacteraceae bacterium]|nr:DUF58 domain-containing protein [Desulfobacteraceae bacterium]